MSDTVNLTIDGRKVPVKKGMTILEAASSVNVYIPVMCSHPGLPALSDIRPSRVIHHESKKIENKIEKKPEKCKLCLVEIEQRQGLFTSCDIHVEEGMVIHTDTENVLKARRKNLAEILSRHPHACLVCKEKDGCDKKKCMFGLPEFELCCSKSGFCEISKVAEYIGIDDGIVKKVRKNLPVEKTQLFIRNHNLCIGCLRCIRACKHIQKTGAIGFIHIDNDILVGTTGPSLQESGCIFCGACVSVCPTGALQVTEKLWPKKDKLKIMPVILPPEKLLELNEENADKAPDACGVYQLYSVNNKIIFIGGTQDLRKDIKAKLKTVSQARYFKYFEDQMYTMRESELLGKYIKEHGKMPELNDDSDLY